MKHIVLGAYYRQLKHQDTVFKTDLMKVTGGYYENVPDRIVGCSVSDLVYKDIYRRDSTIQHIDAPDNKT